jgi:C1A family cysteine protease
MGRYVPPSFGWRQDPPDFRDFSPATDVVRDLLGQLKPMPPRRAARTHQRADLREFFGAAFDQGALASSPAHACAALVDYFERRSHGKELCPSRLFLHRNAVHLALGETGGGVHLRATLKALAWCGLPPERYWPYDLAKADVEPSAFLYSFGRRFADLRYVRLDARHASGGETLAMVKSFLAAGFPVAFGASIPTSITDAAEIPYRPAFDSLLGGQAFVAIGYDDAWLSSTRGALLVRNSWGTNWGDQGNGWLPYAYVEQRLAVDFWTILRPDWLASGEFRRPDVVLPLSLR